MRFVRQFIKGLSSVCASFPKVRKRVYVVIAALCLVLFACGVILGVSLFSVVSDFVGGIVSTALAQDTLTGVLPSVAGWIGGLVASLIAFFAIGIIGGTIILLILSPILSSVADDGWVASGHQRPKDSISDTFKSIVRGICIAFRCLLLQLLCLISLLVLSFVPVVGLLTPVLGILVSSFFYGQSLLDYAVERAEKSGSFRGRNPGSFQFRNIGFTAGAGFLFALLTLIPFIGSYAALFVAPAAAFAGGRVLGDVARG